MPPPTQSAIWAYFKPDELDQEKALCKICHKTYSRKGRTTTSLRNHLKAMHPEEYNSDNEIQLKTELNETSKKFSSRRTAVNLKRPKHHSKINNNNSSSGNVLYTVTVNNRKELIELQKKVAEQELTKINLEIEALKNSEKKREEEHQLKMEFIQKEHQEKMAILRLQKERFMSTNS